MRLRLGRIAPTQREHLEPAANQMADHAAFRPEVENVVLVDLRRDEQNRPAPDARRSRTILDQFELLVAIDHRTFRNPQITSDLIRIGPNLPGHAMIADQIRNPIVHARNGAFAIGIACPFQRRRIKRQSTEQSLR